MASTFNTTSSAHGGKTAFFSPGDSFDLVAAQHQSALGIEPRTRPTAHSAASYSHQIPSKLPSTNVLALPAPVYPNARHLRSVSADPIIRRPAAVPDQILARSNLPNLVTPTSVGKNQAPETKRTRRSWLPGSSKPNSKADSAATPRAWIARHAGQHSYNVSALINGQRVPELWDESGDTLVYLFPSASGAGPSFKLQSSFYASSVKLTQLAHGGNPRAASGEFRRRTLEKGATRASDATLPPTPPMTPKRTSRDNSSSGSSKHTRDTQDWFDETPRQFNLYVPIKLSAEGASEPSRLSAQDVDALVAVRNMFAFLVGQSLIATERRHTIFDLFMNIAHYLEGYEFTNIDGSTFGEIAATSFDHYVEELGIADVRSSREKTIEALVLGEKMRSPMLYNEAFTHAVGKYQDIQNIAKLPEPGRKFNLLNSLTRSRMERASIDLALREKSIQTRLLDFEFPSVFAGVMSSKMVSERKHIRFNAWKNAFNSTRRHVLAYYKQKFGSWPPKASSKKNDLETSGLNRLVLKALYADFGDMYDLFVDRTSITTRSMGSMYPVSQDGEMAEDIDEPVPRIIRRVCDEYDRSYPPVQPPVPFDTPLLPTLFNLPSASKIPNKRLKDDEMIKILVAASNIDTIPAPSSTASPFLASMRAFEQRQGRGSTVTDLVDFRAGMWIFMYVVLQALPMLTVDAPRMRWHQGVEYFLCQPPRGGAPWVKGVGSDGAFSRRRAMNWYGISGGQGVVSLPADLVEHGVEGVYHRSHCWLRAAKWSGSPSFNARGAVERENRDGIIRNSLDKHLPLPPPLIDPAGATRGTRSSPRSGPTSREVSPAAAERRLRQQRSALALGLEALPMPSGVSPEVHRPGFGSMPSPPLAPQSRAGSGASDETHSSPVSPRGAGILRRTPLQGSVDSGNTCASPIQESARSSGKTFDDILSSMNQAAKKGSGPRKTSR